MPEVMNSLKAPDSAAMPPEPLRTQSNPRISLLFGAKAQVPQCVITTGRLFHQSLSQ